MDLVMVATHLVMVAMHLLILQQVMAMHQVIHQHMVRQHLHHSSKKAASRLCGMEHRDVNISLKLETMIKTL
jgi:hypothetical protein